MSKYLKLLESTKITTENKIYNEWFNELDKFVKNVKQDVEFDEDAVMFKSELFEKYDIETLLNLFDFATKNKIGLLQRTIANAIFKSKILKTIGSTTYITDYKRDPVSLNDKLYLQLYELPKNIIKFNNNNLMDIRYVNNFKKDLPETILNKLSNIYKNLDQHKELLDFIIYEYIDEGDYFQVEYKEDKNILFKNIVYTYEDGLICKRDSFYPISWRQHYMLTFDEFVDMYINDEDIQKLCGI